ncbi:MAG: hypothetical protein AAF716_01665 [Cyanobacteria bacterium P01_D01_bin.1]
MANLQPTNLQPTDLQPTKVPNMERPKKGFNKYAEQLNGRAAMVGFVALILIELLTGKGLLTLIGLK